MVVGALCLLACAQPSVAVDKSIYYGHWVGKSGNESISLDLSKNEKASLAINGAPVNQPIRVEYAFSSISPYPFVSILFIDSKQTEHLFYAVIGSDGEKQESMLTGFYEKSRLIPGKDGELESALERLELVQQVDAARPK
jgi:hypothetical protein